MSSWVSQSGKILILDSKQKDTRYDDEKKILPHNLSAIRSAQPRPSVAGRQYTVIATIPLVCIGNLVGVLDIVADNGSRIAEAQITQITPLINLISFIYGKTFTENITKLAEICIRFMEGRDAYTYGHSLRVANYSVAIAKSIGLNEVQKQRLRLAALLHDLGKITFSDVLFTTQKSLTKLEIQLIKMHSVIGANMISGINKNISLIVRSHHENYDGTGYPDSLKGDKIPLLSRIITITDAFDAMLTERPYQTGMSIESAIEEVKLNSGKQFDPQLVEVLIGCYQSGDLKL
jgi:putative nucleotidyltransferase with HDIG domain